MEYINETLGVRIVLPDAPTVRQQMKYRGRIFASGMLSDDIYIRYWSGFLVLYEEWTSNKENGKGHKEYELLPDPAELDIDTATDPKLANLVQWVGNTTALHMLGLEDLPKNS